MQHDTPPPRPYGLAFTGQGGEYFRIWIVNIALTIVTLGIYSAWAKVRRLQYFYRNTALARGSFDYHGDPMAILKGRLVAFGLLLAYQLAEGLSPALGGGMLLLLGLAMPWLLQRSLVFRLNNSSYRGLRFHFDGRLGEAYKVFLLWPTLGYLTLGLLMPLAHQRLKAFQQGNSRYGRAAFGFQTGVRPFYSLYFQLGLMLLLPLTLFFALGGLAMLGALGDPELGRAERMGQLGTLMLGLLGVYLLGMLLIGPWFTARLQNLVWNGTTLGPHRFSSWVSARELLAIQLTNFLGIACTLGLYKPFADIRLARYRIEHMDLLAEGDLESFVARQSPGVSAAGEEAAEFFDLDISF